MEIDRRIRRGSMEGYILKVISLLGGLALFLFGMNTMGSALERLAGGRLQTILAKMSSTVLRGLLLGMAATAVIQSSSATTVMVVGFVNSGIMTLHQAIGVIMGSNVGTTITAWILSLSALEGDSLLVQIFKPSTLAPLLGTIGIVLFLFIKDEKKQGIGTILLGFMVLMTGMELMSSSMSFLKTEQWFADLMVSFSNPVLGILAGAVLTAVIQSSSASVGILQGLCSTGTVTMGTAIPIVLGQNIGTCVTALISTVGANRNARRTALVHLYFNMVGVVIFAAAFYGLGLFVSWPFLNSTADPADVAIFHTVFNLSATAVLLPASRLLEKLAYLTVREEKTPEKTVLLDERLLAAPTVAIQRAQQVASQMAETAARAMDQAIEISRKFDAGGLVQIQELEKETDYFQDALGSYLVKLTGKELSVQDNRILNTLLYAISDFERIADHAVVVAKSAQEMHGRRLRFCESTREELKVLENAVRDVIERTISAFRDNDLQQAMKVEPQEQVVASLVKEVKSRHVHRLRKGLSTVENGIILEDMLTAYGRCAEHCSNVAVEMLQVAQGKLEAHEYLSALKAGQLQESAQYIRRLGKYKAKYTFPNEGK